MTDTQPFTSFQPAGANQADMNKLVVGLVDPPLT